jgi:calcineurin-like phosphoesterase
MGPQVDNPFLLLEAEIAKLKQEGAECILIDFHAEATSEKIAFGRAADGLATLVVGTHTHVQTADERILPGGTAYLTDAGFCGPHESVIGRDIPSVLQKYRTLLPNKFYIAKEGLQADGVCVEADPATGHALRIERIQLKIEAA